MKQDKNFASVSTNLLVLRLLDEEDMYGYQIIVELEQRSQAIFTFREGTLYPVLHLLEKNGYVESYPVKTETNRSRRYYRITPSGEKHLAKKKTEWKIFSAALNDILEGTV